MVINGLGNIDKNSGFLFVDECSDGFYQKNKNGVKAIFRTGDRKVEFIAFEDRTIAYVKSNMGYPAYYPIHSVELQKPVKAVLMDLDGTCVKSEEFWIWIIEMSIASLLEDNGFRLKDEDLPFVSGHSVSEHLSYCIKKYSPNKTLEEARAFYFEHTHHQMDEIMKGRGKKGAFVPANGLKDFLLELKSRKIKIGLVTSGLYEKAYPEILSAFNVLNMGDPKDFFDSIITAGFPLKKGDVGTLGELSPKPHPWLYAETCTVGLGILFEDRNSVVGIEDSGAGVCSLRLAGFNTIGISGGNIIEGGTLGLCNFFCNNFEEISKIIL